MPLIALVCAGAGLTAPAAIAGVNQAPDPGGRERAIVQIPPPGERFLGFHEPLIAGESVHGWNAHQTARVARSAGGEIFRFTIDWNFVEPLQDSWDPVQWARYKETYRAILDEGLKPLIGINFTPPWARDFGVPQLCGNSVACAYPPRPTMTHEWAEFAGEVARRFPRAVAIEIWNEPNHSGFWKPAPEPERYASLVTSAYDAIKAQEPKIQVLAGALAGASTSRHDPLGTSVVSVNEFLTRAYNAPGRGIAGSMDGISFHQAAQYTHFGKNSLIARAFQGIRRARRAYDVQRTPLWITEFGLSTTEGEKVTPSVQANALLRVYRRVITMEDVRALVIHTLADRVELDRTDREHGVGLVEAWKPFVAKPSYCAFAGRVPGRPFGDCPEIREGGVSRCTRSLVRLRKRIRSAAGTRRATLRKRHARKTARCIGRPKRARRPAPRCVGRLNRLQNLYEQVIATLRLDVLVRHERARQHCKQRA